MIIRNNIRKRVISARPFTFSKDNKNIKIRGRADGGKVDRQSERG